MFFRTDLHSFYQQKEEIKKPAASISTQRSGATHEDFAETSHLWVEKASVCFVYD